MRSSQVVLFAAAVSLSSTAMASIIAVSVSFLLSRRCKPAKEKRHEFIQTKGQTTEGVPSEFGISSAEDVSFLDLKSVNAAVEGGKDDLGSRLLTSNDQKRMLGGENLEVQSFIGTANQKPDPLDPSKRLDYLSWDDYFMAVAFLSAQRSKDPNRQVGACIVGEDRVILGIGYNGFPRGVKDEDLPWAKVSQDGDPLKTKYPYVCHAEVNAILNRNHASAPRQRIYVTMFPCNECAKLIIQAGIIEVVYFTDKGSHDCPGGSRETNDLTYLASKRLLAMANVKVWKHEPVKKRIVLEFD